MKIKSSSSLAKKGVLGLLFLCLLSACSAQQTRQLTQMPPPELPMRVILDVPFIAQTDYHCGPASVGMLLKHKHKHVAQIDVVEAIYLPKYKGVLKTEINAFLRSQKLLPYHALPKLKAIFKEVAHGHPVLVMQNLGFSWLPQWHYAVLIGYDINKQQVFLHSGTINQYTLSMSTFERTWQRANGWNVVALNQFEYPANNDATGYLSSMMASDQLNLLLNPISSYQDYLKRWPNNAQAWFNLGNHLYKNQQKTKALAAFHRAAKHSITQDHLNNLAYVAAELGCSELYDSSVRCAQKLGTPSKDLLDTINHPPQTKQTIRHCPVLLCPSDAQKQNNINENDLL